MRKLYSLLLLMVMAAGFTFQTHADVTIKVNKTGIVTVEALGKTTTLDQPETVFDSEWFTGNETKMFIVNIDAPEGYTLKIFNETQNRDITNGNLPFQTNPGNTVDGDVLSIEVTENSADEQKNITFVFEPQGCAWVVTTHFNDDSNKIVEDLQYVPEEGSNEVQVPYDGGGSFRIKPYPGYILQRAKDETDDNPHNTGITPSSDGYISASMATFKPGARIIVTANKMGSFFVKGIGSNVDNIYFFNNTASQSTAITTEYQKVSFGGNVQYSIRSNNSSRLWKVEVTPNEGDTYQIESNAGNFTYIPNDGDKVDIYTDMPDYYANVKFSFEGAATKDIVKNIEYGSDRIAINDISEDGWTVLANGTLSVYISTKGITNLSCTVNGSAVSTNSSGAYRVLTLQLVNEEAAVKEYNINISAEEEQKCNVTFVCENPEGVTITPYNGSYVTGAAISFTSGQPIELAQGSQYKIQPAKDWAVTGVTIEPDDACVYAEGILSINADCTVTIELFNKAENRTKTAVVYVDESVANPTYLSLQYSDLSSVTIKPGYNFVKFCDEDRPFSLGYYAGGSSVFYINDELATTVNPCPQTSDIEDGAVIKYFNNAPTPQTVTYNIADEVADLIEIYHDHVVGIDHKENTAFNLFKGTVIHIKPKSAEIVSLSTAPASGVIVKVDDEEVDPDEQGVYTIKVGDTAPTIAVTKSEPSGVDGIFAEDNETFFIYNLQGIVVKENASAQDFNSLPAGIYIANGQKVSVK